MILRLWRLAILIPLISSSPQLLAKDPASEISWNKTVLDTKFRAEGVAIADVNKDGKTDVLVGEMWYEAPNWTAHEMQKPGDYGDGLRNYSKVFACWAEDLNHDGYPDLIVIDFPGAPCYWLENPRGVGTVNGKPTHWKRHIIWHSACNETPLYADLLGTGKKVLIMGFQPKKSDLPKELQNNENLGQMAYFTPDPKDPTALWQMHPISTPSELPTIKDGKPVGGKIIPGTFKFSHGLGIGDLNGDKRADVMTIGGWWEQPEKVDGKTPWTFHPYGLNDACADMYAFDVDGDGLADILNSSAHKYGIWWNKQRSGGSTGHPVFEKKVLFPELVSETHAAHFKDIDGDGLPDFITGKRKYSHGLSEPGADKSAAIYWLKTTRDKDGMAQFTPMLIDSDSGIGTQFVVEDLNGDGLLDVITANKKGVHVILQQRK
jgi:hypothetical protein